MIAQSAVSLRFPAYTGFAAVLSGAGLPIYIYAPKYYADTYGVSLTVLGAVLGGLRFFDFVQDPVLGWLSERLRAAKAVAVTAGAAMLALSMVGLFAITPPIDPVWWFGLTITGLFTAFSFLTINFYAQGIAKVGDSADGHVRLAAWRESGALMGVCWPADCWCLPWSMRPLWLCRLRFSCSSSKANWVGLVGKALYWFCSFWRRPYHRRFGQY